MINSIRKNLSKDLIFTAINQLWRLISGPLTMVFIPIFLTAEVQGYWYTFTSLSALSIFADLGFSNIVLQFSAHEFAYLSFRKDLTVEGDEYHFKKLASFLVFTIKWALLMIVIVFPIILIIGFRMFSKTQVNFHWGLPWIIYLIGSAISFFNTTILSFIEGCNLVAKTQKIRFEIAIVNTIILLGGLYYNLSLYALAFSLLISSSLIFIYFYGVFYKFIFQLIKASKGFTYSWKSEFFRLLWRYAISFASGYFVFQIYTPLMFKYKGSIMAGQVGISIALWTAIFSLSNTWIYSITPKLNIYISKRNWEMLDKIFVKNLILSIITFLLGSITAFSLLVFLKGKVSIIDRFLPIIPMMCLAISWFFQIIINSLAVYLRAHKEEPLVWVSTINGVYILATTLLCAKFLPADYFFLGFASSYIWTFPWTLSIYLKYKRRWHVGTN